MLLTTAAILLILAAILGYTYAVFKLTLDLAQKAVRGTPVIIDKVRQTKLPSEEDREQFIINMGKK